MTAEESAARFDKADGFDSRAINNTCVVAFNNTSKVENASSQETLQSDVTFGANEENNSRETFLADDLGLDAEAAAAGRPDAEVQNAVSALEHRYIYRFVKRAFDIIFSLAVIVVFSWLFLLIAILIKIDDPKGPVFIKQQRVSKLDADGNPTYFNMLKFRSMCVDAEEKLAGLKELNEKTGPVFKIKNDPRITRVGKWLRKMSLDELPQFFNALTGHISVVGPRPALPHEVQSYNDRQKQRLLIRPGITCYWQTRRNRDVITFEEWVDLDLLYIKQCSLWTDFKLIIQTVGVVLTAQGS